jgi:hypothetical protein
MLADSRRRTTDPSANGAGSSEASVPPAISEGSEGFEENGAGSGLQVRL